MLVKSGCAVITVHSMLDNIISWCNKNKLTVKIKKTKCMFINSQDDNTDLQLNSNGKDLEVVKCFEYLGIHIDNKLSMHKHMDSILKKARNKLGILYKICKFISTNTGLSIYKALIRPHLEYGDFIIDSSSKTSLDKLEKFQEKCLRLSEYQAPEKRTKMSILKNKYGIKDLTVRRKRSLLGLMYNQSKDHVNLMVVKHNMLLRSDCKVKLKSDFTCLTKIQRSPYCRDIAL